MKTTKKLEKPKAKKVGNFQVAGAKHCHQVKVNDCSYPMKA